MSLDQRTALSAPEIDDFLGGHETGVLSLAHCDEAYAIPVSYGYDTHDRTFYMRLVSTPDSEKRDFLASTPAARLVIYENDDDVYRSVIAEGTLKEIPREELTSDHIAQYGDAKCPLFEIWGEDKPDLHIQLYQLDPDEVGGRRVVVDCDA